MAKTGAQRSNVSVRCGRGDTGFMPLLPPALNVPHRDAGHGSVEEVAEVGPYAPTGILTRCPFRLCPRLIAVVYEVAKGRLLCPPCRCLLLSLFVIWIFALSDCASQRPSPPARLGRGNERCIADDVSLAVPAGAISIAPASLARREDAEDEIGSAFVRNLKPCCLGREFGDCGLCQLHRGDAVGTHWADITRVSQMVTKITSRSVCYRKPDTKFCSVLPAIFHRLPIRLAFIMLGSLVQVQP